MGVVATSALLLPAVLAIMLPTPQQPAGPLDTTTLALTARSSLLEQADVYRRLAEDVDRRRERLADARAAEQEARERVAGRQQAVGADAAALYRSGPTDRLPVFGLDIRNAAAAEGVLYQQALAERSERERESAVARAERTAASLDAAVARVSAARAALTDAEDRANAVLAGMRAEVDQLAPEVSGVLAGLGTIPVAGAQQARNEQAMQRWRDYLARLTAGGIAPPPAAELTDLDDLPAGLSPALDADGNPVPGVVWAIIGSEPVTVLPAETVAAVSNALSQLGKPFVAGTAGPETYDCGGFTAAAWLMGGHALPGTPAAQWASGAAVPLRDLQIGDLVFSPGGADVGIYLGDGDVVGASAASYQVGVRAMVPGSAAVRVPLAAPTEANAPLPAVREGDCGAPLPAPGPVNPAWGGWLNGRIPVEALCRLGVAGHALRCDAAASYGALADAYTAEFGTPLCITDSYRSFGGQVAAFYAKPKLAAVPGTSNHGWALAVDLCGGVNVAFTPQWNWMTANAARFGFVQPDWARPGAEKPEPWHWEYGVIS
ncbi:hydrolase [Blastococcus saxobsidens]|uniref:Hydrolase n=1 Tax=Blastococcus saxobsidens TaxID=138336 RepID=A0A6L9W648_9ACTN|nr:hydrolase [Blastococcus saxobsidens]